MLSRTLSAFYRESGSLIQEEHSGLSVGEPGQEALLRVGSGGVGRAGRRSAGVLTLGV